MVQEREKYPLVYWVDSWRKEQGRLLHTVGGNELQDLIRLSTESTDALSDLEEPP